VRRARELRLLRIMNGTNRPRILHADSKPSQLYAFFCVGLEGTEAGRRPVRLACIFLHDSVFQYRMAHV
jgi:hypothetical protein